MTAVGKGPVLQPEACLSERKCFIIMGGEGRKIPKAEEGHPAAPDPPRCRACEIKSASLQRVRGSTLGGGERRLSGDGLGLAGEGFLKEGEPWRSLTQRKALGFLRTQEGTGVSFRHTASQGTS